MPAMIMPSAHVQRQLVSLRRGVGQRIDATTDCDHDVSPEMGVSAKRTGRRAG
jgi:hypothetical protein